MERAEYEGTWEQNSVSGKIEKTGSLKRLLIGRATGYAVFIFFIFVALAVVGAIFNYRSAEVITEEL